MSKPCKSLRVESSAINLPPYGRIAVFLLLVLLASLFHVSLFLSFFISVIFVILFFLTASLVHHYSENLHREAGVGDFHSDFSYSSHVDSSPHIEFESGCPEESPDAYEKIDLLIRQMIDYVIRDFVASWYTDVADDENVLLEVQFHIQTALFSLKRRFAAIDWICLFTKQMLPSVIHHLQTVRQQYELGKPQQLPKFLETDAEEYSLASDIATCLIDRFADPTVGRCLTVHKVLCEILVNTLLLPAVDSVSEPNNLACWISSYLEQRDQRFQRAKRHYQYAKTYEDFVKMIIHSENLDMLKQIRYNIVSEVMEATALKTLKKQNSQFIEASQKYSHGKGSHLMKRDLKRYINQLSQCREVCEQRIREIESRSHLSSTVQTSSSGDDTTNSGSICFSFQVIMHNKTLRNLMKKFILRTKAADAMLIDLWVELERLLSLSSSSGKIFKAWVIYNKYLVAHSVSLGISPKHIECVEDVLLGQDQGTQVFRSIADDLYLRIENSWYPSFLISHEYRSEGPENVDSTQTFQEVSELQEEDSDDILVSRSDRNESVFASFADISSTLSEKIELRTMLLKAFDENNPKHKRFGDEKRVIMIEELDCLEQQKLKLESYLSRLSVWSQHFGRWCVRVYPKTHPLPYDILNTSLEKHPIQMYLYLSPEGAPNDSTARQGWTVLTYYSKVIALKNDLLKLDPTLNNKFPLNKWLVWKSDFFSDHLEIFLNFALSDNFLCTCEVLHQFMCFPPDFIVRDRNCENSADSKRVSLTKLLPSLSSLSSALRSKPKSETLISSTFQAKTVADDDALFESAFQLFKLIFDPLDRRSQSASKAFLPSFSFLRKSLQSIVLFSYGESIEKSINDYLTWLFSPEMTLHYLQVLRNAFWSVDSGELLEAGSPQDSDSVAANLNKCKLLLVQNIPDVLRVLVGEHASKSGACFLFSVIMHKELNKAMIYSLLLIILDELLLSDSAECDSPS